MVCKSYRTDFSLTPTGRPAAPLGDGLSLLPLPAIAIMEAGDLISALDRAAKIVQEKKPQSTMHKGTIPCQLIQ
jgi:hypothetical protein